MSNATAHLHAATPVQAVANVVRKTRLWAPKPKRSKSARNESIDLLANFRAGPGSKPRPTEHHRARTAVILDKLEPVSRGEALRRE